MVASVDVKSAGISFSIVGADLCVRPGADTWVGPCDWTNDPLLETSFVW